MTKASRKLQCRYFVPQLLTTVQCALCSYTSSEHTTRNARQKCESWVSNPLMNVFWNTKNNIHPGDSGKCAQPHTITVVTTNTTASTTLSIPYYEKLKHKWHSEPTKISLLGECLSWDVLCHYRRFINSSIRRSFS